MARVPPGYTITFVLALGPTRRYAPEPCHFIGSKSEQWKVFNRFIEVTPVTAAIDRGRKMRTPSSPQK